MGGSKILTRLVVAAALSTMFACVPTARAVTGEQMTATAFASLLRSHPVTLTGARIVGDLELHGTDRGLTCRDCIFAGNVTARDVHFVEPVDLSGSTISGKLDLSGARFDRSLYARGTTFDGIVDLRRSRTSGAFDVSGATFRAPALFGSPLGTHKSFSGTADFSLATFTQLATFENAYFGGTTDFTLARFDAEAILSEGTSDARLVFRRTIFSGPADFDGFTFNEAADFHAAEFRGPADFSQSEFLGQATFADSRFDTGASFLATSFYGATSFANVEAAGTLDFTLAEFDRATDFAYAASDRTTSFADAVFGARGKLDFSKVSFAGLQMSVPSVLRSVDDEGERDRERVLDLLESSAKERNDLSLANDAHYARQVLRSRHHGWFLRGLDFAFYRTSAGYFVRPLNPLATLLAIAAVFALARAFRYERSRRPEPPAATPGARARARRTGRLALHTTGGFPEKLRETLVAIVPRRDAKGAAPRAEVLAYRALSACILIGLANSNPTLRQMFNAFH